MSHRTRLVYASRSVNSPESSAPAAKARPTRRRFWQRVAAGLKFSGGKGVQTVQISYCNLSKAISVWQRKVCQPVI